MWQVGGKESGTDMGQVHGTDGIQYKGRVQVLHATWPQQNRWDSKLNYRMQRETRTPALSFSFTLFLCPPFCRPSDPPSDPPTIRAANHPSSWPWPRRVECWPQRKIEKYLIGNYELSACLSKKQEEKQKRKILKSTEHNRRTRYQKMHGLKNFNCSIWGCSTGKYPRNKVDEVMLW